MALKQLNTVEEQAVLTGTSIECINSFMVSSSQPGIAYDSVYFGSVVYVTLFFSTFNKSSIKDF